MRHLCKCISILNKLTLALSLTWTSILKDGPSHSDYLTKSVEINHEHKTRNCLTRPRAFSAHVQSYFVVYSLLLLLFWIVLLERLPTRTEKKQIDCISFNVFF